MRRPRKKRVTLLKGQSPRARVDTDPQGTSHRGLVGLYELLLRRFKTAVYIATMIPLYGIGAFIIAFSLTPGIALFKVTLVHGPQLIAHFGWPAGLAETVAQDVLLGLALATAYFAYGFTLITLVPLANFVMRTHPKVYRGPYYSVDFLRWFIHNALTYLVRYTFLEFITPTPFNLLFYRMMGMKIGRGTEINTTNVSDPALITLGKKVTVGGSVTLCAHYGQGGYLVLAPVKIGDGVTLGLKSSVMGGVEIGEGAKILPHSVLLPKTIVPAGEIWGGIPAQKIDLEQKKKKVS